MYKYFLCIGLYTLASVASQYGSAEPVSLSWLLGPGWWVPMSAFTVTPLLDVSRSFTQHYAEQSRVTFRASLVHMMVIPFSISLLCVINANLPVTVFLGAIAAINIGGYIDILIFKIARRLSHRPYIRMIFSNAAATLSGSVIFFVVSYSEFVPWVLSWVGIHFVNPILQDNIINGIIAQSCCIWFSALILGTFCGKFLESLETDAEVRKEPSFE